MALWSTLLGPPGRPRYYRAAAALVVALLAVGAGGAVGLKSHRNPGSGTIGVGASSATTTIPSGLGRSSSSTMAGGSTVTSTASPSNLLGSSSTTRPGSNPIGASTTTVVGSSPTNPGSGGGPGSQQLPPPGTYTYQTSGSYTLSSVFFHQSGSYPSPTHITVAKQGCGETDTWTTSSNSSQQTYACPVTGGLRVYYEQSTQYGMTQKFSCSPNAFIPITTGTVGQQWHFTCTSSPAGTTADQTVTFKGPQTKTVGGASVSTVEVEVVSTFSGNDSGTATVYYWFTRDATAVEESGALKVTSQNPPGTYQSNYDLKLTSLQPS